MRRGILGLLVLVLATVGAPARADATYGSVTGVSGVLYDDCLSYPYRYAVTPPAGARDWDVSVVLIGPDGKQADTDFVSTEVLSGTSWFVLCQPTNLFGRYTIRATFEWLDADSAWQSSALADSSFTMRKPRSRTTLSASTRRPAYGQRVAFRSGAADENPSGYVPQAFAWVHLEKRRDGHWVRIRGSRAVTHASGYVKVRVRYLKHHHRTMRVRAVTEPTTRYARSVSPVIRLW
jgi:hypothetical protein